MEISSPGAHILSEKLSGWLLFIAEHVVKSWFMLWTSVFSSNCMKIISFSVWHEQTQTSLDVHRGCLMKEFAKSQPVSSLSMTLLWPLWLISQTFLPECESNLSLLWGVLPERCTVAPWSRVCEGGGTAGFRPQLCIIRVWPPSHYLTDLRLLSLFT